MNARAFFRAGFVQTFATIAGLCVPLASLRAQSIFSLNAVGYVDVNLVAGSNLVANPLNAATNNVSDLFGDLPDGSYFLPWDQASGAFGPTNHYTKTGGWTDPNAVFIAPGGGFLWLPSPKQISFVGEPWAFTRGPVCLTYPQGDFVSGWFPQAICGICEFPPCPLFPENTTLLKWNSANQEYNAYTYAAIFGGWEPSTPIIGPAEAFRMFSPQTFDGMGPFRNTLGGGETVQHGRSFGPLRELQRNGTHLTFRFAATNGTLYSLLWTTNLRSGVWKIEPRALGGAGGGFATNTVAMTNDFTIYKVHPPYGGANPFLVSRLMARGTGSFSFDFYAPSNASYTIERTINFSAPAWQFMTNVAAEANTLVTFTDRGATAASGYYRLSY